MIMVPIVTLEKGKRQYFHNWPVIIEIENGCCFTLYLLPRFGWSILRTISLSMKSVANATFSNVNNKQRKLHRHQRPLHRRHRHQHASPERRPIDHNRKRLGKSRNTVPETQTCFFLKW
jgi:hypothetical protein